MEAERWLEDWHDRHAGATARAFARARPSSYEWLACQARSRARVLDLACGDGLLLELLRGHGAALTVGVDISAGELAAAHARLDDSCRLVRARAQSLPFGDASFDLVTCHLALMLLHPITEVLTEVHRVLEPGGRLVAIVGPVRKPEADAWSVLSRRLARVGQIEPQISNPDVLREPALRELLHDFEEVTIEPLTVDLSGSPDELWALFIESYPPEMMGPDALASLEQDVRSAWRDRARRVGGDTLPCAFKMLAVSATR